MSAQTHYFGYEICPKALINAKNMYSQGFTIPIAIAIAVAVAVAVASAIAIAIANAVAIAIAYSNTSCFSQPNYLSVLVVA